jgi:hypothetical protein
MVIDGAESQYFMDRELEEMLDEEDVVKTGITFTDIMWDSANDRFDLQDQFDGNRPIDLNKSEFIEAAVAAFNKDVNSNLESAFEERLGSDMDYDKTSFDSDKFKAIAERQYRDRLESLFEYDDDDDEGPGEPPTPPSGGGDNTPGGGFTDYVIDLAEDDADLDKDLEDLNCVDISLKLLSKF